MMPGPPETGPAGLFKAPQSPGPYPGANFLEPHRVGEGPPQRWQGQFRRRIRLGAIGFILIFGAVALKLIDASIIAPVDPNGAVIAAMRPNIKLAPPPTPRAPILDRNGRILAVSLPGAALYADPRQIWAPKRDAAALEAVLPELHQRLVARLLADRRLGFVYLDRKLTAAQELSINRLGIPGFHFQNIWTRHYPQGDLAAHILGGVTPNGRGIAGIEEYFNKRLEADPAKPLRLSLDIGVESIVRREIVRAMRDYHAKAACGIVESMTGRIVAMSSVPDYDSNDLSTAPADSLFNRCISGDYEPGSVMKLMTLPMALNSGLVHYWDRFDTTHPLIVDGFAVTDYEPVHYWLAMPAILAFSSNIGASRIATMIGPRIQRLWLRKMGFFTKSPIQLPGAQPPIWHPKNTWKLLTTMTVSFGNGIAMAPIILVNAVVADMNGGVLFHPTLLAAKSGAAPRRGVRVMRRHVSRIMRKLMRGVVVSGTGTYARVSGYLVGGKTGTAQVVAPDGRYYNHLNDSSFIAAFPMNHPRYVVYVMVIQPHPTKKMMGFSHGFTTGGYVAAPAVGRIIARVGPLLGVMPLHGARLASANKRLTIPLKPPVPPGHQALGPGDPFPPGASAYAYRLADLKTPRHRNAADRAAYAKAFQADAMAIPGQVIPADEQKIVAYQDRAHENRGMQSGTARFADGEAKDARRPGSGNLVVTQIKESQR